MDWPPVAIVVVLALGFAYTNGFHDTANAIATSVSTRALTPRVAVTLAACANLLGAFFGARVAQTVGNDIIAAPTGPLGLAVCASALLGATVWNLLTWARGLPSSSSHALLGGLGGAALAAGVSVRWAEVVDKVLIPMLASPIVGLVGGYAVMSGILWTFRHTAPVRVAHGFRLAQTVSASAVAFGHGMQDAAKTAGMVALALTVGGHLPAADAPLPVWVVPASAAAMSAGTYAGGWRIMRTLGRRIIDLDPPQGFAAEATAATILYAATALRAPISTTQAITSAILGSGATRRFRAVRWGVVADIGWAWVLTFPGAGLLAAGCSLVLRALIA